MGGKSLLVYRKSPVYFIFNTKCNAVIKCAVVNVSVIVLYNVVYDFRVLEMQRMSTRVFRYTVGSTCVYCMLAMHTVYMRVRG